jgi:hypothetical protein
MKDRNSVGYMSPSSVADDQKIILYYQKLTSDGEVYNGGAVPGGGGTAYKLKNDYSIMSNNCATMSCDGLEQVGQNWLGDEFAPNDGFETMEDMYKDRRLMRTEYNQGGKVLVTYTPPPVNESNQNLEQKLFEGTVPPQDNTTVKRVILPAKIKDK